MLRNLFFDPKLHVSGKRLWCISSTSFVNNISSKIRDQWKEEQVTRGLTEEAQQPVQDRQRQSLQRQRFEGVRGEHFPARLGVLQRYHVSWFEER